MKIDSLGLKWIFVISQKYVSFSDVHSFMAYFYYTGVQQTGVCHGDELNFIFPFGTYLYRKLLLHNTESDRTMINIMNEFFTSFAKNGYALCINSSRHWLKQFIHLFIYNILINQLSTLQSAQCSIYTGLGTLPEGS